MKIVFFGTPEFAVESLDALRRAGYDIAAVVTAPDKPGGRGHGLIQSDVKRYAVVHDMRLMQPVSLKDPEFVDELQAIGADLFVVIAFRMLPEVVWQMPPMGTFNLHGSLLPRYRGAAPINWAIIRGEERTGVTTFLLKHQIDTGDILRQESIEIGPDEDFGSVYHRLMHLGARLTLETVRSLAEGTATPQPQSEAQACPAPKIHPETCMIDWSRPPREIHNLVRGLAPVPGARTLMQIGDGKAEIAKIWRTEVTPEGELRILEIQPPGKKRMAYADFMRGIRGEVKFS